MTAEQTTHAETVNPSNINAGGNVNITATDGDINLIATNIHAIDVLLDAKQNLNLDAAQNQQQIDGKTSSSSWSLGASFGLDGNFTGLTGGFGSGHGTENGNTVTHTGSVIDAAGTVTLKSGNDTNIIGSQVKGDKVVADIGGNLNLASTQDSDDYAANNQSTGIGFGTGKISGTTGSFNTGKTNSNYDSVTGQAGIFAGAEGFDIYVGKNTDLKGAVIASDATPDKNKLSTDTLTYSDIQNKAEYSASSVGVGYAAGKDANGKDVADKDKGLIPNIGVTASGEASSTTKSAISLGTIDIRSNPTQDISNLNRTPEGSINALGKIFDKQTVKEQQELANLFGQEAFKAIGNLGLTEGSPEKVFLDAFAGGLMAQLGGGSFASGAAGAGFNQLVQLELAKITDPALHQWASAVVGIAAASVVGGNAQTGASTAVSETRNNWFWGAHVLARTAAISAFRYLSSTPAGRAALQKLEIYSEEALIASEEMMAKVVNEANALMTRFGIPGRVQSRINLITGDLEAGWEHVLSRHFNTSVNASQFTVAPEELQGILQSEQVIGTPILRIVLSDQGPRFLREVTLDKIIGIDKFSNLPTSVMTVLTDLQGNLVTATPGVIK
ncbi:hemagglutinin repeat-containing protein [Methylomusa anaerophila]|uniref:Filamentous hemagglutinin n=2 Tax=Methylomusa anaerophila TaxID=1930071 RepID=A0A348ALG5_9FIRM|nr:hemagglutinin repeat-containing protein [Methylomusa anaerophila]BBB91913.1 filamentous hemagglutinin [Methylomusa anaerophila]